MWFDLPDDPLGGRVEILHLNAGDIAEIKDQAWEIRNVHDPESERGFRSEQQYFPGRDRQLTVCRAVVNWEHFVDADGRPMACTEDNKKLWAREDGFMAFVNECRARLADIVAEERERTGKN